jgi:CRISPR-associated protein Cas1
VLASNPRHAVHPTNALLNVAFAVAAGSLTAQIVACGLAPAIGFLHSDKPGRHSLIYDAIEPVRPLIEHNVVSFIRKRQFGANDFVQTNDGSIRINDDLLKVFIAETALRGRVLDAVTGWIISLVTNLHLPDPVILPLFPTLCLFR